MMKGCGLKIGKKTGKEVKMKNNWGWWKEREKGERVTERERWIGRRREKTKIQAVCEREGRGYYRSDEVRGCVRDGINAKCLPHLSLDVSTAGCNLTVWKPVSTITTEQQITSWNIRICTSLISCHCWLWKVRIISFVATCDASGNI